MRSQQPPSRDVRLSTDADIEQYLARRHSVGYDSDITHDGLTLTLIRSALKAVGDVFAKPHRAFLRWSIRHLLRRNERAGRPTTEYEAYVREILAIDAWTLAWPFFHIFILYAAVYMLAVSGPGPLAWSAIWAIAALSIYRTVDICIVLLRLHVAERYVPHLSSRAVVGTFLQLIDITTAFAIGYILLRLLAGRAAFGGEDLLATPLQPWYYSFVTITTLGYGDITARGWPAQLMVVIELFVGLSVVAVILQHVISPQRKRTDDAPPPATAGHDAIYASFIDRFRHEESFLKNVFRRFLPELKGHGRILDIGCGRGEFLDLMREEQIECYGVETNMEFVQRCRARSLDVQQVGWAEHLRSLPDGSLGGIVAMQVVEHMTSRELLEFLQSAARKVRPGGILIAETLTPCLNTLLRKFWVDITHVTPLHPDALSFFVSAVGFRNARIDYYNEIDKPLRLVSGADGPMNENFERLSELVFRPHYYAVVATR